MLKKSLIFIIIALIILPTAAFCIVKPQMHKPFQFNILDYFIKINDDDSTTMTKTITKTEIREVDE